MPGKKQMKVLALLNVAAGNKLEIEKVLEELHEEEVLEIYRSQMRRHALIACLALQQRGFVEVSDDRKRVKITPLGKAFLRTHAGAEGRKKLAAENKQ